MQKKVQVESLLDNIQLDDLSSNVEAALADSSRDLFMATAKAVVELQDCGGADPQATLEMIAQDGPEIVSQFSAQCIKEMAALILSAEIPKLSECFARMYREFNVRYFAARLPEYTVRVVFDVHKSAHEPVYDGSVSSGLIRYQERCIYLRYTKSFPIEAILIHEMAHAATQGDHGEEWLTEMRRLKAAGAPVATWELD